VKDRAVGFSRPDYREGEGKEQRAKGKELRATGVAALCPLLFALCPPGLFRAYPATSAYRKRNRRGRELATEETLATDLHGLALIRKTIAWFFILKF